MAKRKICFLSNFEDKLMSEITAVSMTKVSSKSICRSISCFFSSSDCDFATESSRLMIALISECERGNVFEKCKKLKATKARSNGMERVFIIFIGIHSFQ